MRRRRAKAYSKLVRIDNLQSPSHPAALSASQTILLGYCSLEIYTERIEALCNSQESVDEIDS